MSKHRHIKQDIKVSPDFIEKFAKLYIEQRSKANFNFEGLDKNIVFKAHGFSGEQLEDIIKRNVVAKDIKREAGEAHQTVITDIYRSDLGELLMTYYFEEKIADSDKFRIPEKNISFRELASQPGRGIDAIGFRTKDSKLELLLGEAKVSHQKKNPPAVVDSTSDSIYQTQKKFKNNKEEVVRKLSDYIKRLNDEDALKVGSLILFIELDMHGQFDVVFGCSLVRDASCVKIDDDYGKMLVNAGEFDPNQVHFCILNFDKSIEETVGLFYDKVQELCSEKDK